MKPYKAYITYILKDWKYVLKDIISSKYIEEINKDLEKEINKKIIDKKESDKLKKEIINNDFFKKYDDIELELNFLNWVIGKYYAVIS